MPVAFHSVYVRYALRMSMPPWARLTTFITPKMRFIPEATRAYTPPTRSPRITVCRSWLTTTTRAWG